jgi:hypothetical protein
MEIKIKHTSSFAQATIVDGQTTIDLGLMNDNERDELAGTLLDAAYELGPRYNNACAEWFVALLAKRGIELPNTEVSIER